MTYNELVSAVATDFENTIKEEGFDSFADMTRCYQMDSEDIRTEVMAIVLYTKEAWMDEDSGEITIYGDGVEPYKYRSFIAAVRKELKNRGY